MIPQRIEQWVKTLIAAVVGGAANAGLAALGISAGSALGETVKPLDLRQLEHICVSGAIVGALLFLKQSPVPPDSQGNTQLIKNPNPPTTNAGANP